MGNAFVLIRVDNEYSGPQSLGLQAKRYDSREPGSQQSDNGLPDQALGPSDMAVLVLNRRSQMARRGCFRMDAESLRIKFEHDL